MKIISSTVEKGKEELVFDTKELGFFIGWDLNYENRGYEVKNVMEKMSEIGLPEEACEIRARSAILRAIRDAAKGKSLIIVQDNDSKIQFQLTKIAVEDDNRYGKIAKFLAETMIFYNKSKNEIECDNKEVKAFVTEKFLIAKSHYKTNDITRILLRLFKKNGDIVPLRERGGAYMVPAVYKDYVMKVKELIKSISIKNRVRVFKIGNDKVNKAEFIGSLVDDKTRELKKFRQKIIEMEKSDEERVKQGLKPCHESLPMKRNRKKELAMMRKRISLWSRQLDYESEELKELLGKCSKRLKKYFGGE